MALIKCKECNKDVSDKAAVCPHCGVPIDAATESVAATKDRNEKKSTSTKEILIGVVIIAIVFIYFVSNHFSEKKAEEQSTAEGKVVRISQPTTNANMVHVLSDTFACITPNDLLEMVDFSAKGDISSVEIKLENECIVIPKGFKGELLKETEYISEVKVHAEDGIKVDLYFVTSYIAKD